MKVNLSLLCLHVIFFSSFSHQINFIFFYSFDSCTRWYEICLPIVPREYEWWRRLPIPQPCRSCSGSSCRSRSTFYNNGTSGSFTQYTSFDTTFNIVRFWKSFAKAREFGRSLIVEPLLYSCFIVSFLAQTMALRAESKIVL